jgi:hypothetical protein
LNAANITTGAVGIGNGGTGATTAVQALANLNGASLSAPVSAFGGELTGRQVGGLYQVDQFAGADIGAKLTACIAGLSAAYGGICDARNFSGTVTMGSTVTVSVANTTILLPCATIATSSPIVVPAGVRNVTLKGCGLRGASTASGSQGGTVLLYSGSGAAVEVGDPTYAVDTMGFHLDDVAINVTGSGSASMTGFTAYRAQELDVEGIYFLGNANQTGMVLDGTENYTGGTFLDLNFNGFQTAVSGIGHQVANAATTDWMNASTFVRLHIDCPTSGGSPIAGTFGINLAAGDGNTFTGGDVEGCGTALHLGSSAENNTIVGLRNENSTNQVVADSGSSYNSWITGGTMFAGELTDNGTRNSFLDSFHRTFNGVKGDWYQSQLDGTVTNHLRVGTGVGNERGLLSEYQTDYGYRWETGLTDGTSGEQFYNVQDLLSGVSRLSIGQYLSATADTVTNVILNNGGCYTSATAPAIGFSGGGGTGAAATATMAAVSSTSCSGYQVSGVTMTSGGSGYTSQPALTFTGSNQVTAPNAVAEITLAGSTNNQTVLNATGTGAVVLNGSNNAGTGGLVIGSGGPSETTVATVDASGNANLVGTLQVGGVTTHVGSVTVKNQADAEIDSTLWAGLTASQKESFIYKDWNGASQWYMEKDAGNNWVLNSAMDNTDHFKAYQGGETMLNSNGTGYVSVNREANSGTGGLVIFSGGTSPGQVAKVDSHQCGDACEHGECDGTERGECRGGYGGAAGGEFGSKRSLCAEQLCGGGGVEAEEGCFELLPAERCGELAGPAGAFSEWRDESECGGRGEWGCDQCDDGIGDGRVDGVFGRVGAGAGGEDRWRGKSDGDELHGVREFEWTGEWVGDGEYGECGAGGVLRGGGDGGERACNDGERDGDVSGECGAAGWDEYGADADFAAGRDGGSERDCAVFELPGDGAVDGEEGYEQLLPRGGCGEFAGSSGALSEREYDAECGQWGQCRSDQQFGELGDGWVDCLRGWECFFDGGVDGDGERECYGEWVCGGKVCECGRDADDGELLDLGECCVFGAGAGGELQEGGGLRECVRGDGELYVSYGVCAYASGAFAEFGLDGDNGFGDGGDDYRGDEHGVSGSGWVLKAASQRVSALCA